MKTKMNNSQLLKKMLIMPLLVGVFFLFSCESAAQAKNENGKEHVEKKSHDYDGEGHESEQNGHDKDEKNHEKEHESHIANHEKNERGEHKRDKGEKGEGEEDGTELRIDQTYDLTKHGVRLVLKYNKSKNIFEGYMQNTTKKTVERARVEVHLSNGIELGPTKPLTLAANAKSTVVIKATTKSFTSWSAHAEVGNLEHGHGKEGENLHDGSERKGNKERGEHG